VICLEAYFWFQRETKIVKAVSKEERGIFPSTPSCPHTSRERGIKDRVRTKISEKSKHTFVNNWLRSIFSHIMRIQNKIFDITFVLKEEREERKVI
jgi:hypothetical protein